MTRQKRQDRQVQPHEQLSELQVDTLLGDYVLALDKARARMDVIYARKYSVKRARRASTQKQSETTG